MQELDLQYICAVIGNLSGVPIRVYQGGGLSFYHSLVPLPKDPVRADWEKVAQIKNHVGYFVTPQFYYYGVVNSGSAKIVIGPTRHAPAEKQELRELAFQTDVPAQDVEEFVSGMRRIVSMPLESVLQMLCTVNYILNGEKLELRDIVIYEPEQDSLRELLERQHSAEAFRPADGAAPHAHNTYALEQAMLRMVRRGDTAALRKWIAHAPAVRGGTLSFDQLRQLKNTFIVTATLASRAAIHGGMDSEEAFSLSDAFIQRCELLDSIERITNLQYHMVLEFTQRAERIRFGGEPAPLAAAVARYVQRHLSEPIRTEQLARELFLSRPHLSAKFKAETGETLTDFILREKTEEAKRLLRYSDKSATAIGSYLGFSSLGHFSRVFKKYAGCTPGEYRGRYSR